MANFLTRWFGKKAEEVLVPPVLNEDQIPTVGQSLPHTIISFTEQQEAKYSDQEKQELQKLLLKMPPLQIGDINFIPFEAGAIYGGYYVKVFIRNGREVTEEFTLDELPLALLDSSGDRVAFGVFRLSDFGILKFGETRVWTFAWRPEQVLKQTPDLSSFTVAFE